MYGDYLQKVSDALTENPAWRLGQAYFNVLTHVDPGLAERVRGTVIDPFYSDEILPEFLDHIRKEFERKTIVQQEQALMARVRKEW